MRARDEFGAMLTQRSSRTTRRRILDAAGAARRTGRLLPALATVTAVFALASASASSPHTAVEAVPLPAKSLYPESLAADRLGNVYVGSVGRGGIVVLASGSREPKYLVAPGAAGSRSIFGIQIDQRRRLLWACSNDLGALTPAIPAGAGGTAVEVFDQQSGEPRFTVQLPEGSLCNDIAVASDGTAYVTDTIGGRVFRIDRSHRAIEWLGRPEIDGSGQADLDGISFGPDGHLYLTSFVGGQLFRVDPRAPGPRKVQNLRTSRPLVRPDALRQGPDGAIYLVEGEGRLSRLRIKGEQVALETIASDMPGLTGLAPVAQGWWIVDGRVSELFDRGSSGRNDSPPPTLRLIGRSRQP